MSPAARRVIVVATEDTAARWARGIRDAGVSAVACAWSSVVPATDPSAAVAALARRDFDLVLLTSASAVEFLPVGAGAGLVAAAVGDRTAREARRLGFSVDVAGRAGSEALAKRLLELGSLRRVLWLRGETAFEAGAAILRAAGWPVTEAAAYRTVERPGLAEALLRLGEPAAYVLGSPAAARATASALGAATFPPPPEGPPVVVVGEATAKAARGDGRFEPVIADSVEVEGLVRALRSVLPSR